MKYTKTDKKRIAEFERKKKFIDKVGKETIDFLDKRCKIRERDTCDQFIVTIYMNDVVSFVKGMAQAMYSPQKKKVKRK